VLPFVIYIPAGCILCYIVPDDKMVAIYFVLIMLVPSVLMKQICIGKCQIVFWEWSFKSKRL